MNVLLQALNLEQAAAPAILMLLTIIKAHHNATGKFPTEDQIAAAIPVNQSALKDLWAPWTSAHPTVGLPPAP
jgi:hypothetical protein